MTATLQMSDEELSLVHLLVSQDAESSRIELRHTGAMPYRELIKRRLDQESKLLARFEEAMPTLRETGKV